MGFFENRLAILTLPFAVLFIASLCMLILKRDKPGWVLVTLLVIHTATF
jgi:hypothetical protein